MAKEEKEANNEEVNEDAKQPTAAELFSQEVEKLKELNEQYEGQINNDQPKVCRVTTTEKCIGGLFIAAASIKFFRWCLK